MAVIRPNEYYHEQDKKALEALQAIPGFTPAVKALMKVMDENMYHGVNMASKIRLGPEQMPHIYNMLPPICETLGIEEPELYLEMNPIPNGTTYGDTKPFITLTSGLIESLEEDEIRGVIAHECGHIACRHTLYWTMARMIMNGSAQILNLGVITVPLQLAFFHWMRCCEFSCDRAAAICMGGYESVAETMLRLAGGPVSITKNINMELFLKQAEDYENILGDSAWDRTLQYLALMESTHPYSAVRAYEIKKWCESDTFKQIMEKKNAAGENSICPNCGAKIKENWKFCKCCGTKREEM